MGPKRLSGCSNDDIEVPAFVHDFIDALIASNKWFNSGRVGAGDYESILREDRYDIARMLAKPCGRWRNELSWLSLCGSHPASFQRAAALEAAAAFGIALVGQSADANSEVANDLPQHGPLCSHFFRMTVKCSESPVRQFRTRGWRFAAELEQLPLNRVTLAK